MFAQITLEVIDHVVTVCNTEAQRRRILSAYSEAPQYHFEDVSRTFGEPAVRVKSIHSEYLCFPNQCTCGDWKKRGPVLGSGEIAQCKHQLACEFNALFAAPVRPRVDRAEILRRLAEDFPE